jgi:alpha-mannosidase
MYCIPPVLEAAPKQPMKTFMALRVGDHGGGPTKINLRTIEEVRKDKEAPIILYSSVDDYFEEVRAINLCNYRL